MLIAKSISSGIILALAALLLAGCGGQPRPTDAQASLTPKTTGLAPGSTPGEGVSTLNPSTNGWATYQNATYGFSFEYPAIYNDPLYKTACGIKDIGSIIQLGARIEVDILQGGGLSLDDFASQYLASKNWMRENQDNGNIGGVAAINVEYKSVSNQTYGTVNLVKHGAVVLVVGFTSGPFCADLGSEGDESNVYQHVLESFKI